MTNRRDVVETRQRRERVVVGDVEISTGAREAIEARQRGQRVVVGHVDATGGTRQSLQAGQRGQRGVAQDEEAYAAVVTDAGEVVESRQASQGIVVHDVDLAADADEAGQRGEVDQRAAVQVEVPGDAA